MGVSGRPIRACAEPMPNTIPSSAAPNSTIRPASIVNRNSFRIGVLPLYVHHAGNNLLDFVREASRPRQLVSQLATQTKFHLIIATELRRDFTDASRGSATTLRAPT